MTQEILIIERKSALNPLLWLIGILTAAFVVVIIFCGVLFINITLGVLVLLSVSFFFAAYRYLAKNDPDRLHTIKKPVSQRA